MQALERMRKEVIIEFNKNLKCRKLPIHTLKNVLIFNTGGYMFFETSLLNAPVLRVDDITIREGQNAYLESPILMTTGADGKCVSFR